MFQPLGPMSWLPLANQCPPSTNPITFSPQLLLLMACTSICCIILTHLAHLAISRSLQYFLPSFHISGTVDPSISLAFCLHQITLKDLALLVILCLCPTFCFLKILLLVPNCQACLSPFKCPLSLSCLSSNSQSVDWPPD